MSKKQKSHLIAALLLFNGFSHSKTFNALNFLDDKLGKNHTELVNKGLSVENYQFLLICGQAYYEFRSDFSGTSCGLVKQSDTSFTATELVFQTKHSSAVEDIIDAQVNGEMIGFNSVTRYETCEITIYWESVEFIKKEYKVPEQNITCQQ
ncbi:MAG: hypothetical protein R3E90_06110 [Marinicella sp.]